MMTTDTKRPLLLQCYSNEEYRVMIEDHRERHQAYADRHGYDYEVFDMVAGGVDYDNGWSRLQICLDRIQEKQWSHVFWLDADCIVLDPKRDMRDTLPTYASFAYTIHPNPVAAYRASQWHWQVGQMYYRSDYLAPMFLEACLSKRAECANDQHAVNTILMRRPDYQAALHTLYQSWNNTLHCEQPDGTIVAAFHGYGRNLAERRAAMQQVSANYPWTHGGYAALARERLGSWVDAMPQSLKTPLYGPDSPLKDFVTK